MTEFKKSICIDFDGVIHSYTSGWKGIDQIPDPPVPGAIVAIMKYIDYGYDVCIYSSRSKEQAGILAMIHWFLDNGMHRSDMDKLSFPTQKPPAWLTIDDRCICFNGQFPDTDEIDNFKPWFKQ